jgi:hypothetical protein
MAVRWNPGAMTDIRPSILGSAERERRLRERGISAELLALLDDPRHCRYLVNRPDPEIATEIELYYTGLVVFASTDWQDQFVVWASDGTFVEVQLQDGVHATYDTLDEALVQVVLRAWELDMDIHRCRALARDLGLKKPDALVEALRVANTAVVVDEEWQARVLPTVL